MADPHAAKTPIAGDRVARMGPLADLPCDPSELPADVRAAVQRRHGEGQARRSIGRYVITGEVGRGGMGLVYEAWDPKIERRVAVKTIEPDLVPDPEEREEVIERFRREIKVVGRLRHPGIVTIFDFGQDPEGGRADDEGGLLFYVMEFLEGRSLSRLLRERELLPDVEAVSIAVDIAEALQVAHGQGVIHRDIKPSNIFIETDGQAVLLDFGIAKTSSPGLTRQGQILGTPSYLAPERLREKEVPLDGRADLFSLGVLLYTMLVGRAPFVGANVYDLIDNIATEEHPQLERATEGGRQLSTVLDRLLAKDPSGRYASAGEAAAALREVRLMLEASTPIVADLEAHLAPVHEPMGDAATELASATGPERIPISQVPVDGTRPEVALHRRTQQIAVSEELADALATSGRLRAPVGAPVDDYESSYPSPKVWGPNELEELAEEDVQLLASDAEAEATADDRDLDRESTHVGALPERPLAELEPEETDDGEPEARPPVRRFASVSEDETLAEPAGLSASGGFPAALLPVVTGSPEPTPRSDPPSRARRPRIQASLVDEADVIVRPAALDDLKPDEMPTQSGNAAISVATPVKPYDPIETDIVRPRKLTARDPADFDPDDPDDAPEPRIREPVVATLRPGSVPNGSAAVARRTFGVDRAGSVAPSPAATPPPAFPEIKVSGTDLEQLDRGRVVRNRVAILLGAALVAVAVGLLLGRAKQRQAGTSSAATPAPIRAKQAERREDAPALVPPRGVSEILADAEAALGEARLVDADRLFARAIEAAPDGSDAQLDGLLGRARTMSKAGVASEARGHYRRILELRSQGRHATIARAALAETQEPPPSRAEPRRGARPVRAPPPAAAAAPSPPARAAPARADDVEARCRSLAVEALSDPKAGVAAFERLAREAGGAWCAHKNLAVLYGRIGDDRSALRAFRRYLELRPAAPDRGAVEQRIKTLAAKLGS